MYSADPKTVDLPEISPAVARLILAVALSLALHLGLFFLVRIGPASRPVPPPILRVVLEGRDAATRRMAEASATLEPRAATAVEKPARTAVVVPPGVDFGKPSPPPESVAALPAPVPTPLPALDISLVDDPTYYTARQLDVHPQAAQPVRPDYPESVAVGGVEGYVTLKLLIDDGGKVREASVVDAQPPGVFEESALAAFRAARFQPGQRNGRPVKSQILIKVTYELLNRK